MSRPVQLIVRLPYNRPQDGSVSNPPIIHWTPDKEQLFWEVITKSREAEGSSIEWSALADHLEVPLPYLLYRASKRFEEGLQNLKAVTGSPDPQTAEGSKHERRPTTRVPCSSPNPRDRTSHHRQGGRVLSLRNHALKLPAPYIPTAMRPPHLYRPALRRLWVCRRR
ncbi:hypothetical protein CALVIDRAFT_52946 [Calocera viscosa TUFC12733]|uniref:Atg29 N-terminal domain-containing protein n=1 Tax=Calocera viscosa (strain TUFC12733) TaxID=1330018 RepID=A0A167NTE2_CALVF|nr:hypothetical protein CALVIDRAFT_52946 [Calocera viscosa TUFC12733]